MRQRPRPLAVAVCLAATVLAGCAATDTVTVTPRTPGATVGGSATVGILQPSSIDPVAAFDPASELVVDTICDTLLGADLVTGELLPALVESWAIRGNGTRFLLRLRDATFHDGRPVTAGDVVYSLNRLADPDMASPAARLLSEVAGYREFRGLEEARDDLDRRRLRGIRESSTGDAVEIFLAQPNAEWLTTLTHPATAPVSRAAVEADADAFRQQPVCAGPYRVTSPWRPGTAVIDVERFDDYHARHGAFTGGGAGYLDRITFRVVPDSGAAPPPAPTATEPADGADNGAGDDADPDEAGTDDPGTTDEPVVAPPPLDGLDVVGIPAWRWDEFRDRPGVEVVTATGPGVDYVGVVLAPLSGGDEQVDRVERGRQQLALRRALSLALDRTAIATEVFGGGRVPATSMVPPSATGKAFPCEWLPERADPRATQFVSESGVSFGDAQLELLHTHDFANPAMALAVAKQWSLELGVRVQPRGVAFSTFVETFETSASSVEAFRTSWSVPVPSRSAYLHDLFHSSQIAQGNLQQYADFRFDELLTEEARRADDATDRELLLDDAEAMVCDQLPLIPVVQQLLGWALSEVASASDIAAGGHAGRIQLRELYRP